MIRFRSTPVAFFMCLGALAGCATQNGTGLQQAPSDIPILTPTETDLRPVNRPERPVVTQEPLTVETASTVTQAEQVAATETPSSAGQDKGTTIVSLGLLDRDGFWMQTPLVGAETDGRVLVEATGASVNLRLVPNGAAAGSGSQLSIAAMQALGIPITDLTEVRVFVQ